MLNKIYRSLFSRGKTLPEPLPDEVNYGNILNYVYRNSSKIDSSDLAAILETKPISNAIDEKEKKRIAAYFHFFKSEWQKSLEIARPLATTEPYDQDMVSLMATLFSNSGQYKKGLETIEKYADDEKIENKELYFLQRCTTAWCAGDSAQALKYLTLVLEISPQNPDALSTKCAIYNEMERKEELNATRQQLLELCPGNPDTIFFEGMYKLGDGDIAEGLALYETRYQSSLAKKYFRSEVLSRPRWDGTALKDQKLYLCFEQGLGDTLMTCRYLDALVKVAPNIEAECQPEAKDLLQSNYPEIKFFSAPADKKIDIEFDYWIGSMSLPYLFNGYINPPHREGYLAIESATCAPLPLDLESDELKIGISWSGNPAHTNDPRRSIPWAIAKDFIERSGLRMYAIQTFIPEDKPDNLINISDYLVTLTDTAHIVSQLDLIITVDTSLVHLAGALGKKTWLLCHNHPEWRWGTSAGESHWYQSVTLYKQSTIGDWPGLLNDVFLNKLPLLAKDNT